MLFKVAIIGLSAIATLTVVMKIAFFPVSASLPRPNLLPENIRLNNWQQAQKEVLTTRDVTGVLDGEFVGGDRYNFHQGGDRLTIMVAQFENTNGDLKKFIKTHSPDLNRTLNYEPAIGYYSLFSQGQHLGLTACIQPPNYGTITADQFKVYQVRSSLNPQQILGWLSNHNHLNAQRCLWAYWQLTSNDTPPQAKQTLKNLWQQWLQHIVIPNDVIPNDVIRKDDEDR